MSIIVNKTHKERKYNSNKWQKSNSLSTTPEGQKGAVARSIVTANNRLIEEAIRFYCNGWLVLTGSTSGA